MPVVTTDTFLRVAFSDKDKVKALGARFDFDKRSWFIPAGLNSDTFDYWIPKTIQEHLSAGKSAQPTQPEQTEKAQAPATGNNDKEHMKLSDLLNKVTKVIKGAFSEAYWVQVEVSKFTDRGQHAYFDLIEYDENGKEAAKARGSLWQSNKNRLLSKFNAATDSSIQDGMKLLLKLSVEFNPQYGLSFIVQDIDPAYTLGDMEAKLKAIRDALVKANIYTLNKNQPEPLEFTRVAVISPDGAAGLADFMKEADLLTNSGLCDFVYYTATFQGKDSAASLRVAFKQAYEAHGQSPFDALVVIRGGGAASDLAWLNEYNVATLVCKFPIPVFTGIGHQVDNTILDEVAFRRFDTPSKVSAYIAGAIVSNAENAINNTLAIIKDAKQALVIMDAKLEAGTTFIQTQSLRVISKYEADIATYVTKLKAESEQIFSLTQQRLDTMLERIGTSAFSEVNLAGERVDAMMSEVIGLSPKKTLQRGYAIIRDDQGNVLSNKQKLSSHHSIDIEMHDGHVKFIKE